MVNPVGPAGRTAAYERLREIVLADPSMQGAFLTESSLVKQVGLSRTPIREALIMLAADGLVELIPHRGAYVPPSSPKTIRDTFEMRRLLEQYCARVAIAAGTVPLAAMRQLLDEQQQMDIEADQARDFISTDQAFHAALVNAADNAVIAQTYRKLRVQHVRFGISAATNAGRRIQVLREHESILEALAAGDAEAAVEAIGSHIDITRDILLSQMDLSPGI